LPRRWSARIEQPAAQCSHAVGDDTRSNQSADCDPYEAGKSEMKRHFTADHVFQTSGEYRVQFHLKKKDKTIASATTTLKVTPGLGDPGRY